MCLRALIFPAETVLAIRREPDATLRCTKINTDRRDIPYIKSISLDFLETMGPCRCRPE